MEGVIKCMTFNSVLDAFLVLHFLTGSVEPNRVLH